MIKEDIIDFLRTGQLTHFPFGIEQRVVIGLLGDNPVWTIPVSRKDKRPALIKYGQTEFYFNEHADQQLYGVQITCSMPADSKGLAMDYKGLYQSISYDQVKDFLAENAISFQETVSDSGTNDKVIRTSGEVVFYFSGHNNLEKFGRFLSRNAANH